LTYLKQDLAAIPLITSESLAAYEHDLADFSEQTADFQEAIVGLKQQQSALNQSLDLTNNINRIEQCLAEAENQLANIEVKLKDVNKVENAQAFKDDLSALDQQKQTLDKEHNALKSLRNELQQIQRTLDLPDFDLNSPQVREKLQQSQETGFSTQKQTVDGLRNQVNLVNANWQAEIILQKTLAEQIKQKQVVVNELSAWLEEHAAEQLLLDRFPDIGTLKSLRIRLTEFEEKQKTLSKWSKYTNAALEKNQSSIAKRSAVIDQLKAELSEEEAALEAIGEGRNLVELEDLQADQRERVKHFQELIALASANERLSPNRSFLSRLFGKPQSPERHTDDLVADLENIKEQYQREENIRLSLERVMYTDALIARLAHERSHLIDGKPCPLCGATEHPYAKFPPSPANSEKALDDQIIKLKRLSIKIGDLEEQIKFSKRKSEKNQVISTQLVDIRRRWHSLCNLLNIVSDDMEITNIGAMKSLLSVESTDLSNIGNLITKYKSTQKKINKLTADIKKTETAIAQLQAKLQGIDAEWQTGPQRFADNEAEINTVSQEAQTLADSITESLTALGEKLPAQGREDALIQSLSVRRQDYQGFLVRRNSQQEELNQLMAKQTAGQAQISIYQQRVEETNRQLRIEEAVGLQLALIEKQKMIADKEADLQRLTQAFEASEQAFSSQMKSSQFTSFDDIRAALTLYESHDSLVQEKTDLDNKIEQYRSEHAVLSKNLSEISLTNIAVADADDIDQQLKSLQEKMAISVMEAERIETLIREQKQFQAKYDSLLDRIENQQQTVNAAQKDVNELAAENGMAFRRRVQDKVIEQLLSQTNAILEKISGRYYLRRRPSEHGLSLVIEDTFQANARRLPKTLSGGESFIVSLALALGLSELASQGKSVDSLFLDEGFGNLDAENLFTVINTLESLRAHGKTVGVISHVEAVHKRFKAQLQLVKKPDGLGELRKVS
jgi:exonuclease SbcC